MLSRHYEYDWSFFDSGVVFLYSEHLYLILSDGVDDGLPLHQFLLVLYFLYALKVVVEVDCGVGVGLTHPQYVMLVGSANSERQSVVESSRVLYRMVVPLIADIFAGPSPDLLIALPLPHRKNTRQHAIVEQRVIFAHVDDVYFERLLFGRVVHSEIEPLRVALCVDVVLQH